LEQFKNTTLLEQLKNLEKQKIPHEQALVNVGRGAMCLKTVVCKYIYHTITTVPSNVLEIIVTH
jgi:hypothetical protein